MWCREMAVVKQILFYIVLGLFVINCPTVVENSKLNVPRVLLPLFNGFSTNFTLEVSEHGCYKWTSSRLDVVQLIPIEVDPNLGCSKKVVVSTSWKESTRNTVIVLAEDVETGLVLRCDVIVDKIVSLNIVTTTRELFMEEAPEMFEIRAYDDQGNEFTTLEGVEFQWSIGSLGSSPSNYGNQVLRFMSFADSTYETPPSVAKFDAIGLRGHIVLIEGVKTGSAKVSVQMAYPEYYNVAPVEVQLSVVANLLLDPPDAYILQGDTVRYRLLQAQHGKLEEIEVPSTQYFLEVEDENIAILDKKTSVLRGHSHGRVKVYLRDKSVHSGDVGAVRLPTATLTVTEPAYLMLDLLPHHNWAAVTDEVYTIVAEIYNRDNHRIHIGDAVTVRTTVPESLFRVQLMTRNGTHLEGMALKPGSAPVFASLESVRLIGGNEHFFKPPIIAQAEMYIYSRVTVIPSEIFLPWDVQRNFKSEIKLKAGGGDGSYAWDSSNCTVAVVTQSGVVRSQGLGQTNITVMMQRNKHNKAISHVNVVLPAYMEIVDHILEAEVGKPILLNIAVFTLVEINGKLTRVPFTSCEEIPFQVKIWDSNFYYNKTSRSKPIGVACAVLVVIGKSVGNSKVTVSYAAQTMLLEASTVVAAYQPLEVLQPVKKLTVLAVGASRHIVWTGGPRAWLSRPAEHKRIITADSNIFRVTEVARIDQLDPYVYSVVCLRLGEGEVTLTVTNVPNTGNYRHVKSAAIIKVICAKPRFITLAPETMGDLLCPLNSELTRILMLIYKPAKFIVTITDAQGNIFDNATSLHVDWVFSKNSLAFVQFEGTVMLEEQFENNYVLPLYHYQSIIPKNRTGIVKLIATVVSYRRLILNVQHIIPEHPSFGVVNDAGHEVTPLIETAVTIVLVEDTQVTPNRTSVFNHPHNKVTLKVSQGSGHYQLVLSTPDIADVHYYEATHIVEVLPKSDGVLVLTLQDVCLPSKPAVVEIQVLKVSSMQVDLIERVEKGKSVVATVWLYDSVDNALAVPNSELLELRPHLESDIVSIKLISSETHTGEVKFEIFGRELGNTFLTFTSGQGDREIRSQPLPLQVFPPLRLLPRNITVTVGTSFQITSTGGPQPDCAMEFMSGDSSTCKVNSAGLIEALKIGYITVTGMAVGYKKGTKIIYSKDTVDVHVIPLEGVKIHSPLSKLKVGAKMPVWAKGIPDKLSPLILGSVQPPLLFKWSLSVPDIAQLQDVLHFTGVEIPDKDKVSMRLIARKPGHVTLKLVVVVRSSSKNFIEFSDTLELEIFEELRLIKPPLNYSTEGILLAPETQMQLRTNKDSVSGVTYKLVGSPLVSGSIINTTALSRQGPVVSVGRGGLLTTHTTLGHALILVHTTEDYGVEQTIGINVEVKPVHYIMLNVNTKLYIDPQKSISSLPRGLDVNLSLTYHDNKGSIFAATRIDLKTQTNRFDNIHIVHGDTNGTLIASLTNYGQTVLRVWDESSPHHSEDYVKFSIDNLISPAKNEVTVGDIVCFSMPLVTENGELGTWSSSNPEVLSMDLPSGVARARSKTGSALVTYTLSNTITASTLITVLPNHSVLFLPLENRNLSNWSPFSVPLILLSDRDSDKMSNLLPQDSQCQGINYSPPFQQMPFTCEIRFNSPMTPVDVHQVFSIKPQFSMKSGLYSCTFEALASPSVNTSILMTNVTLRAISDGVVSEPLVVPFLPAAYLHMEKIYLSDKQATAILTVTAIPQVLSQIQLMPEEVLKLSVGLLEVSGTNTGVYRVSVTDYFWSHIRQREEHLRIFMVSPITNQNITVEAVIQIGSSYPSGSPVVIPGKSWYSAGPVEFFTYFGGILGSLIYIAVIVLALVYGYVALIQPRCEQNFASPFLQGQHGYGPRSSITNQSPRPTSSSQSSPRSSERSSFLYRQPFSDTEPVYGDPNFIQHSPDLIRRNRS